VNVIDRVDMSSESRPVFLCVEIQQFARLVHTATEYKVPSVVELNCPNGLVMFLESVSATGVEEIPDFYSAVS
jgi:hypothetical protein